MSMWVRFLLPGDKTKDIVVSARPAVGDNIILGSGEEKRRYEVYACTLLEHDLRAEGMSASSASSVGMVVSLHGPYHA